MNGVVTQGGLIDVVSVVLEALLIVFARHPAFSADAWLRRRSEECGGAWRRGARLAFIT
jgi:hypothetical protein